MNERAAVCYRCKKDLSSEVEVDKTIQQQEMMPTFSKLLLCEKCGRELDLEVEDEKAGPEI